MENEYGCSFCNNAWCDPELEHWNDLSYLHIGKGVNGFCVHLRSGDLKETVLLASSGMHDVWVYSPKYCPECGRRLLENKSRWHKESS